MRIILPNKSARTVSRPPIPIEELLLELGINPTTVIVVKNGRVVREIVQEAPADLEGIKW